MNGDHCRSESHDKLLKETNKQDFQTRTLSSGPDSEDVLVSLQTELQAAGCSEEHLQSELSVEY